MDDMAHPYIHPQLRLPLDLAGAILDAASLMARQTPQAYRLVFPPAHRGATLRPGKATPLWNELRAQLRPHLKKRGEQANLARVLGLPRQQINAFVTGGGRMPDAERTLQLMAWLLAVRQGRRPA